jgi:hypothetical protein
VTNTRIPPNELQEKGRIFISKDSGLFEAIK